MVYDANGNIVDTAYTYNGVTITTGYDVFGNLVEIVQKPLPFCPVADRTDMLYTIGDKYISYDGTNLRLSTDGGYTFGNPLDVSTVGIIKNIHLFSDNTLNIFGHQKAYWCDDWETLHEATLLDYYGNAYAPSTYDNFTITKTQKVVQMVDGVEMYVFGNYGITDESNTKRNIWYTTDKGKTYKVAYPFNTSGFHTIRHIHAVVYNPNNQHFICSTGDNGTESCIIEGTYNSTADTWKWSIIGEGTSYKWSGTTIVGNYLYRTWDNVPGKVYRVPLADYANVNKHEVLLDNLPNDPVGVIIGERGDIAVTLSIYRSGTAPSGSGTPEQEVRKIYYSPTGTAPFTAIQGDLPSGYNYSDTMYYGIFDTNAQGKILTGLWSGAHENLSSWDKVPSFFIDDVIRENGFPNAFNPL